MEIHPEMLDRFISQYPERESKALIDFALHEAHMKATGASQEEIVASFAGDLGDSDRNAILQGYMRLLTDLGEIDLTKREARIILRDQLKETLTEFGIIEC
jgi:hypothetical protein